MQTPPATSRTLCPGAPIRAPSAPAVAFHERAAQQHARPLILPPSGPTVLVKVETFTGGRLASVHCRYLSVYCQRNCTFDMRDGATLASNSVDHHRRCDGEMEQDYSLECDQLLRCMCRAAEVRGTLVQCAPPPRHQPFPLVEGMRMCALASCHLPSAADGVPVAAAAAAAAAASSSPSPPPASANE